MALFEAVRWTFRGLVATTCRPTVVGLENVPKEGPFIVAPNHLSFSDSVIVQALMPRPVAFFAKAEYFTTGGVKGKVMKSFFESVGSIPVERGEQAASVQALKTLMDILEAEAKRGKTVIATTHDLACAAQRFQRVAAINRTVVAHGPSSLVLDPDVLSRTYGGHLLVIGGQTAVLDDAHHHDEAPGGERHFHDDQRRPEPHRHRGPRPGPDGATPDGATQDSRPPEPRPPAGTVAPPDSER